MRVTMDGGLHWDLRGVEGRKMGADVGCADLAAVEESYLSG
jgi:hypothetical protein